MILIFSDSRLVSGVLAENCLFAFQSTFSAVFGYLRYVLLSQLENSSNKDSHLGKFEFELSKLLKIKGMNIRQPFPLEEAGHHSKLNLRMKLRVSLCVCRVADNKPVINLWFVTFIIPGPTFEQIEGACSAHRK